MLTKNRMFKIGIMSSILVIILSCLPIFNLSLISVLSWVKSKNITSYFWLGWMCFASAAASFRFHFTMYTIALS